MGLMSMLAYFEASSANSAIQNAVRETNETREQRELLEKNEKDEDYFDETKNKTRMLFQDLYKNYGDISKIDLTHLQRIKASVELKITKARKSYDDLEHFHYEFSNKSKIILLISIFTTLICIYFISKGQNFLILLCISLYINYIGFSSYKKYKFWEKDNKETSIKRSERKKFLIELHNKYLGLTAEGIIKKSYLDNIIHDIIEALSKSGDEEKLIKAYNSFLYLITDVQPDVIYFNSRFKEELSFNNGSLNEYNSLIKKN
jgi:hypothetical protein